MSKQVEEQDADLAIELVQYAYFKKTLSKNKRKKRYTARYFLRRN